MKQAGYYAAVFMDEVDSIYAGIWGEEHGSPGFTVLQQLSYIGTQQDGVAWAAIAGSSSYLHLLVGKWLKDPAVIAKFPLYPHVPSLNATKFKRFTVSPERATNQSELEQLIEVLVGARVSQLELNVLYLCTGGVPRVVNNLAAVIKKGATVDNLAPFVEHTNVPTVLVPLAEVLWQMLAKKNPRVTELNIAKQSDLESFDWFELEPLRHHEVSLALQTVNASSPIPFTLAQIQELIDLHAFSGTVTEKDSYVTAAPPVKLLSSIHRSPSSAIQIVSAVKQLFHKLRILAQ